MKETIFKYYDDVRIKTGFYRKSIGTVTECTKQPDNTEMYKIALRSKLSIFIKGDNLELAYGPNR